MEHFKFFLQYKYLCNFPLFQFYLGCIHASELIIRICQKPMGGYPYSKLGERTHEGSVLYIEMKEHALTNEENTKVSLKRC